LRWLCRRSPGDALEISAADDTGDLQEVMSQFAVAMNQQFGNLRGIAYLARAIEPEK
jgi:hypothetical protein